MRKSTWIMAAIVLMALGGMLVAANTALGPLARDVEASRLLTRYLGDRGDVVPQTRVRVMRARGGAKRLAAAGPGVVVEVVPSEAVRTRSGGLTSLARTIGRVATEELGLGRLEWIEIGVRRVPGDGPVDLRTLLAVTPDGDLQAPAPPLPATIP